MALMAWRRERFELFSKDALIVISPVGRGPSARPGVASSGHCAGNGLCRVRQSVALQTSMGRANGNNALTGELVRTHSANNSLISQTLRIQVCALMFII